MSVNLIELNRLFLGNEFIFLGQLYIVYVNLKSNLINMYRLYNHISDYEHAILMQQSVTVRVRLVSFFMLAKKQGDLDPYFILVSFSKPINLFEYSS